MKKEAREQAIKMFMKAKGKVTNKQIADAVKVNPLTIGRWKKEEKWEAKLKAAKPAAKPPSGVVRKKAARDKALQLFLDSGGKMTNKELARRAGVSPATISKWKELDRWSKKVAPATAAPAARPATEAAEFDMGALSSPEQIIRINQRIDGLLQRDYLTAGEVAELAAAKRDMLDAVEIYVAIARELGAIKS
jgi:uncharacterized protein YjcR